MGHLYVAELKEIVVTAVVQDIFSIVAPATNKVVLHGWELTSTATAPVFVSCNLHRISATGTGGGTPVAVAIDELSPASTDVLGQLDTTPGADAGGMFGFIWEQVGPVGMIFTPEMRPKSLASQGFALTWNSAVAATLSGWLCWEIV